MGNVVLWGKRGFLCAALWTLIAAGSYAVEESALRDGAPARIRGWFDAASARGHFPSTRGGVPIEYAVLPVAEEKGALVLLPGESSGYLQYRELAYDLRDSGWSLYMMDLRGQGLSGRLPGVQGRSYVHDYRDWMTDLYSFFRTVVSAKPHARVVLMGRSVGASLAALFASENPALLSGVVLVSPMFRFPTPLPEPVAYTLLRLEILFGREMDPVPWKTPDSAAGTASGGDPRTTSAVRSALFASDAAEFPAPSTGGATVRLLKEIRDLGTRALRHAGRIGAPVLLLEAAEDVVARRDMMEEARRRIRSCRAVVMPEARHDLLFERDAVRDAVLGELSAFLAGRAAP